MEGRLPERPLHPLDEVLMAHGMVLRRDGSALYVSGQLQPGQTIACIGFGGGLTWGGMIVEYDPLRR